MRQLISICSRMRRLVALSSTTSTRSPSRLRDASVAAPRRCGARPSDAVKWNVLPLPIVALDPDLPAHQLDQPLRDGEAEAGAAEAARRGAVGLRERLRRSCARLSCGNADAGVAHREGASPHRRRPRCATDASARPRPRSVNLTALPRMLSSTCRSRAASPSRNVGHVRRRYRRRARALSRRRAAPAALQASPTVSRRSNACRSRSSSPRLDLREIEDVVDQTRAAPRPTT